MCGLVGFVGEGSFDDLAKMKQAIAHRGPDQNSDYIDESKGVFLGHHRLSIIDIKTGQQPMLNIDKSVILVFNGEIYNHLELRDDLKLKGYKFLTTNSDSEVLIHGWQEWGIELPQKLNGMFAFAIYDKHKKQIFCARDRHGEKPLFWSQQKGNFYFASELNAFDSHSQFVTEISPLSLAKYFTHGFIPSPNSLYKNAYKLSAGHSLLFNIASNEVNIQQYWQFRAQSSPEPRQTLQDSAEEILDLLRNAVKRRSMSDVDLGVFISGGIDSSLVATLLSDANPDEQLKSFSIGFNEKSFDESPYALSIAQSIKSQHRQKTLDYGLAKNLIAEVLHKIDEPISDPSIIPTYYLCKLASEQVKVALSGDGGDEIFIGYDPFKAMRLGQLFNKFVPKKIHKGLETLVNLLPDSAENFSLEFKLKRALKGMNYPESIWNPVWLSALDIEEVSEFLNEPFYAEEVYSEVMSLWNEEPDKSIIDKTQDFYANFYLPDNILTKVDRAAMLNGLEVRSIFLDNDLVDYANSLPAQYKFDGRVTKKVLKLASASILPDEIINRPKKGFGIPTKSWLEEIDLMSSFTTKTNLQYKFLNTKIGQHQSKRKDHRLFLWSWLAIKNKISMVDATWN